MSKKIVFTGETGFIGRHLKEFLNEEQATSYSLKRDIISMLSSNADKRKTLLKEIKNYEVFIHLAGLAHITGAKAQDYKLYEQSNVDLALEMAQLCVETNIKKFIFVSSIGVHGRSTTGKEAFKATDIPNPETVYAQSKLRAEEKLKEFCKSHEITLVIIRPPLVYHKQAPGNIAKLRKALINNIPLPLACLKNKRSIVTVKDLCMALLDACTLDMWDHSIMLPVSKTMTTTSLLKILGRECDVKALLFIVPKFLLLFLGKITKRSHMVDQLIGDLEIEDNWKSLKE